MSKSDIQDELAHGSILPLLIRLTVPATVAQLVNALYSIVDRIYIGHMPDVGSIALSGIGLTFPITMLIAAFSFIPSMGGAPLASIAIGKGDYHRAQLYLCNSVTLLIIISIVISTGCLLYTRPLLCLIGADGNTLPYACAYLQIYLLGTIFVELSMGLNAFINTQGYTLFGTISILIGAIVNIILDPIFIYDLKLGIRGAALASIISQAVSCIWIVSFLLSKRSYIKLNFQDMMPRKEIIISTCKLGFSPFTFRINESLITILVNRLLLIYGGTGGHLHLAAMTIISSVQQVFFMPLLGIVNGVQPIISFNFGSRNYPRIRHAIHHARILSVTSAALMWIIIVFFPHIVCLIFTSNTELIELTARSMRIMFSTVFCLGLQMINQNAFIAMGNARYSFFFGILRKILLLIPLLLLLPRFLGVWGIYAAEAVANPIATVLTALAFERYLSGLNSNSSSLPQI